MDECNENITPNRPYNLGDWVKVRKPRSQVLKGHSPYTRPLRVIKVLGKWTYKLSDNQVRNARRMSRFYASPEWEHEVSRKFNPVERTDDKKFHAPSQIPRRSARQKKGIPPQRFSPGDGDSFKRKGD